MKRPHIHTVLWAYLFSCVLTMILPNESTSTNNNSLSETTAFVNLENTIDGSKTSVGQNLEQRATRRSQELTTAQQAQKDTTTQMNYTFVTDTTARSLATDETFAPANQSSGATKYAAESWHDALFWCHLVVSLVGVVANKITFITLMKNGDMFSPAICLLLKHQSLVDLSVCILAPIFLMQPPLWNTNNYYIDAIICYIWHSQRPYWAAIYLSVFNLVVIAVERYLAVCHPLKHMQFKYKHLRCIFITIYLVGLVFLVPGSLQVRFKDGACLNEILIQGRIGKDINFAYTVVWFCVMLMLPVTISSILYGRVIMTLRRRQNSESMPSTHVIDAAQSKLTKMAVLLTCIFTVSIGFDAFACILRNTGLFKYKYGSKIWMAGLFATLFNSVINPFIYVGFMPLFRVSLRKTFSCRDQTHPNV